MNRIFICTDTTVKDIKNELLFHDVILMIFKKMLNKLINNVLYMTNE